MSGITLKIASLLIRTLAKPIANQIKVQAREHDRFRTICVNFAQSVHRVDMRLRLGLLQDHAAIERQLARDAAKDLAASNAKKVSEGAEASSDSGSKTSKTAEDTTSKVTDKKPRSSSSSPKIRPLAENKAIELGANFFSETFIFTVAVSLLVFERWYSSRREKGRRNDLAENLAELEERDREHGVEIELLRQEVRDLRSREKRYWSVYRRVVDGGDDAGEGGSSGLLPGVDVGASDRGPVKSTTPGEKDIAKSIMASVAEKK